MKKLLLLPLFLTVAPLWATNENNGKLVRALYAKKVDEALQALNDGADVHYRNALGETPLFLALRFRASDTIINAILARSPNLHYKTLLGETALHAAAAARNHELCNCLLLRGADPYAKNVYGQTPHDIAKATLETKRVFKKFKHHDITSIYQIPEPEEEPLPRHKRLCLRMNNETIVERRFIDSPVSPLLLPPPLLPELPFNSDDDDY